MKLPKALLAKTAARFDSLIAEGQHVLETAKHFPPTTSEDMFGNVHQFGGGHKQLDWSKFVEWRSKTATLLAQVIAKGSVHAKEVESLPALQAAESELQKGISFLKAVKDDLQQGFLDSLFSQIEAEIAADYMGQAERLLTEGQSGKYDHVPAAVLAGAVLEESLRTLCSHQMPPIALTNARGEKKTLNPLIDDLKKAEVFTELKAKQLRSWADIRNKAAHGEFDHFTRADVEQMLQGINNFLADYR